ncbi:MAG: DUF2442 domain-containing protein [Lacipirellulaceae bacterium]
MIPRVIQANYIDGYRIQLKFQDGTTGTVDLADELWGPVFEPLRDLQEFQKFEVHPELETLTWPNGADFAPEFLYEQIASTSTSTSS